MSQGVTVFIMSLSLVSLVTGVMFYLYIYLVGYDDATEEGCITLCIYAYAHLWKVVEVEEKILALVCIMFILE